MEEQVLVRSYHRRQRVAKITATDDYFRLRLQSPDRLRARGFMRARTIDAEPGKPLPGLTAEQRRFAIESDGKIIYFFRGKKGDGEGRPQSILIPRRKRREN